MQHSSLTSLIRLCRIIVDRVTYCLPHHFCTLLSTQFDLDSYQLLEGRVPGFQPAYSISEENQNHNVSIISSQWNDTEEAHVPKVSYQS